MKKNFKLYLVAWGLLLAIFNAVAFIAPVIINEGKYNASFWIGYGFIMLAFAGQLICAAKIFNQKDNGKVLYNIPLFKKSFACLIVSFIAGIISMFVTYWIAIIICVVVLLVNLHDVFKLMVVINAVSGVDEKVKEKTFFIKSLTIDAETLMARASDDAIKAECRKVAEALRYSDPMSSDALSPVEGQISAKFADLSAAVAENDKEKTAANTKELLALISDRNKKCRLLK